MSCVHVKKIESLREVEGSEYLCVCYAYGTETFAIDCLIGNISRKYNRGIIVGLLNLNVIKKLIASLPFVNATS